MAVIRTGKYADDPEQSDALLARVLLRALKALKRCACKRSWKVANARPSMCEHCGRVW